MGGWTMVVDSLVDAVERAGMGALIFCAACAGIDARAPIAGADSGALVEGGSAGDGIGSGRVDDGGGGAMDSVATTDAAACQPINVAAFQPPPYPGVVLGSSSLPCSAYDGGALLVQSYGDACLGHAATYETCRAFAVPTAGAAAACYQCLVSDDPSSASFSAVVRAVYPVVNYPACVQALDPSDAGLGCARSAYDAAACAVYACQPNCPVSSEATRSAFETCTNEAAFGPCVGYALPAAECLGLEQNNPTVAAICFAGSFAEDHYLAIAHHFCGGG
jgi:hypothetical protein